MKNEVLGRLDAAGVTYRLITHAAVHHVGDEAPELAGLPITKCLLLTDPKSGAVYMVAMRGEERLDLKKLGQSLGAGRLKFVPFDDVEQIIGVAPGAVSVFAVCNGEKKRIQMVFDSELMKLPEIGFHPNENTATVVMTPQSVIDFLMGCGYTPLVVEL